MNLTKVRESIFLALNANLPIFLQGSPGIGKSDLVKSVASKCNLELIDLRLSQCDITDLNGLPKFENGKASFQPFDIFPLTDTPLPAGKNGWLLFLDEINAAVPAVQVAAYKLILDRMVGNHHLHPAVRIVCAGNKATDNAVVNELSSALRSRFITVEVEPNTKDWLVWGEQNGIDYRILAFLEEKPNLLFAFDPEKDDGAFPCPRTWHMLSRIIKNLPDLGDYEELLKGIVGNTAYEFVTYSRFSKDVPKFKDIIDGTAKIDPKASIGVIYMTLGSIVANIDEKSPSTETECKRIIDCINTYGSEYLTSFNSRLASVDKHKYMIRFKSYMQYITSTVREAL